jgi:SOS response associated peptidase (SRAP)
VLTWGFVLLQKDRAPRRVTNVRDDKILESKFWRPSFEQRRCLVPASSYCEPKGEKPATWHWFSINGHDARPVFAFPGVWTRYKGPLKKNGENVEQETLARRLAPPPPVLEREVVCGRGARPCSAPRLGHALTFEAVDLCLGTERFALALFLGCGLAEHHGRKALCFGPVLAGGKRHDRVERRGIHNKER